MTFELTPEVEVYRDADGQVTQLRHMRQRYSSNQAQIANPSPAEIAEQYVRDVAGIYGIEADETTSLHEAMPSGPVAETPKLRQVEEKNIIDTTTVVTFQQTAYGLPVWNSNLSVVVAGASPAVVSSTQHAPPRHRPQRPVHRPPQRLRAGDPHVAPRGYRRRRLGRQRASRSTACASWSTATTRRSASTRKRGLPTPAATPLRR